MIARSRIAARPYWLLDLVLGERTYQISTDAIEVDGAPYQQGLADLQIEVSESRPVVSVAVEGVEQWAEIVRRGVVLGAGRATLSRWHGEDRITYLVGRVVEPSYGRDWLEFQVDASISAPSARPLPPAEAVIDGRTWPVTDEGTLDESVIGAWYPWIFGRPGWTRITPTIGAVTASVHASPAYLVESHGYVAPEDLQWPVEPPGEDDPAKLTDPRYSETRLLIAGHEVEASTVLVHDATVAWQLSRPDPDATSRPQPSAEFTVQHQRDKLGRMVALVQSEDADNGIRLAPGHEYWITWSGGGGLWNRTRTAPLRGLGEIIEWMLDYAGVPVDRGRMEASRAVLDRARLDFAVVEPVEDLERFIEDTFGGMLPLIRREGPGGVWYELRRYEADPEEAVAVLVVDGEDGGGISVTSTGVVSYSPTDELATEVVVAYRPRVGRGLVSRVTVTGEHITETVELGNRRRYGSRVLEVALSRHGDRRVLEVQAEVVHDDDTALWIAQRRAVQHGIQRRRVELTGGPELEALSIGSVVAVVDEDLALDHDLGIIRSLDVGMVGATLDVELLDAVDYRRRA